MNNTIIVAGNEYTLVSEEYKRRKRRRMPIYWLREEFFKTTFLGPTKAVVEPGGKIIAWPKDLLREVGMR